MVEEHGDGDAPATSRLDGHKLSEFIYGTVTGMVAVAGIGGGHKTSWWEAALVIITRAVAIWVAHAYSILISKRIVSGRRLKAYDLGETLAGSWPIVSAGVLLTILLLPVAVGLWSLDLALRASNFIGVLILVFVGILAGVVTQETWPRRILLVVLSAGLGLAVVAVEFAVHH
jgi:hypothetical protein